MADKVEFQFEELDYQANAVQSVLNLLNGIPKGSVNSIYSSNAIRFENSRPYANRRFTAGIRLIENMQKVQFENGLFRDSELAGHIPNFTIEMETGTGKTFVYLKTILSLWAEYDFKKFMIVVPSNAILLGVKASINMLADYFKPKFDNMDLSKHFIVFDKNTGVEHISTGFVQETGLSIMLVTCHSFNKENNRLRKDEETGRILWDDIKDIAPIVIIDEPQKMEGSKNKKSASLKAIEELNPLMVLRYSATHKNLYNQIYKLDSYQAYKDKLVKGIKVKTVHSLIPKDYPYIRYVGFTNDLKARIEIFHSEQGKTIKFQQFCVELNQSLHDLSGLEQYKGYYVAEQPHKLKPLKIITNSGILLFEQGQNNDEIKPEETVRMQIRLAIEAHLDKQTAILESGRKIKALTLFFIDSVEKVRSNTSADGRGEYFVEFDRLFSEIRAQSRYQDKYKKYPEELKILNTEFPIVSIREGYFAIDKKSNAVNIEKWDSNLNDEDISINAKTQEDIDRGIDLILQKKDELITFNEPLTFIFSHSALREGWDNPNVFTMITLKHGGSEIAKKQEIGRGLRLPVDINGNRCKSDDINELTVIANDYYDHFAVALQNDFNDSMGFDKNEVSADIIKSTLINAGINPEKIEVLVDRFKQELIDKNIVKIAGDKLILTEKAKDFNEFLFSDETLNEHSIKIKEEFSKLMADKGTKKIHINNGDNQEDENGKQKYVTEEDFSKMYNKMLYILQKKTIYRYEFNKDEFISECGEKLNELLSSKGKFTFFEVETGKAEFTDTQRMQMSKADPQIEIDRQSKSDNFQPKSDLELTNYIMYHTMLPRLAILKIISLLISENRKQMNNQDYLDEVTKCISEILVNKKSKKFTTAELIEGYYFDESAIFALDKIPDEIDPKYYFEPNSTHHRAINKQYYFDSEGERKFAKELDDDGNVMMYTKLKKGGFVIDTPIGKYSPDWAIVYRKDDDSVNLYFIAETKWDKPEKSLMDTEKIKINCAKNHFKAINLHDAETVKFEWVNSYETSDKNSFPQVFFK